MQVNCSGNTSWLLIMGNQSKSFNVRYGFQSPLQLAHVKVDKQVLSKIHTKGDFGFWILEKLFRCIHTMMSYQETCGVQYLAQRHCYTLNQSIVPLIVRCIQ